MKRIFPTPIELVLLRTLLCHREATATELAEKAEIKLGSIYVLLQRLEGRTLVKTRIDKKAVHPGLPRPLYSLTARGKRVLALGEALCEQIPI